MPEPNPPAPAAPGVLSTERVSEAAGAVPMPPRSRRPFLARRRGPGERIAGWITWERSPTSRFALWITVPLGRHRWREGYDLDTDTMRWAWRQPVWRWKCRVRWPDRPGARITFRQERWAG